MHPRERVIARPAPIVALFPLEPTKAVPDRLRDIVHLCHFPSHRARRSRMLFF
jgi:hypothetical protein